MKPLKKVVSEPTTVSEQEPRIEILELGAVTVITNRGRRLTQAERNRLLAKHPTARIIE